MQENHPISITLSEALAVFGITHKPSSVNSKRDWFNASGEYIGTYEAYEGWVQISRIAASAEMALVPVEPTPAIERSLFTLNSATARTSEEVRQVYRNILNFASAPADPDT